MGSYCRYNKFIKGFAELNRSLVELTKRRKQFIWTGECLFYFIFIELKESFISPDILAYPLDEGEYIIGSDVAIGGVLFQIQYGSEKA